jgi:hypothetical protein
VLELLLWHTLAASQSSGQPGRAVLLVAPLSGSLRHAAAETARTCWPTMTSTSPTGATPATWRCAAATRAGPVPTWIQFLETMAQQGAGTHMLAGARPAWLRPPRPSWLRMTTPTAPLA